MSNNEREWSMEIYQFTLTGHWQGGRGGTGVVATNGLNANISIPSEMGGPGIGTNPDELLLAAAANCYMNTLAAIMENRKLGISEFDMVSEAEVILDGGRLKYNKIVHKPRIRLNSDDPEQRKTVDLCTQRAEKACMISQAVRGNVEVTVIADVRGASEA
jgi:peroxiredoxin-like protein